MSRFYVAALALVCAPLAFTQEMAIEEIVITSSFTHQEFGQLKGPVHVVAGSDIANNVTQSIGEHLSTLAGVSSNNFGPAVGQPVIRGMSGARVKVLQNGLVIRDAAGIGPDHANDIDLNNIQQIEVIRGPSAILYANGASGGIINIVDNTIARSDVDEPLITLSAEGQSVNDGKGFSGSFRRNLGGLNLSYDYKEFDADDYDVPTGAILHDDEHEDEPEGDLEAEGHHDEDMTTLEDSYFETTTHRFGLSKAGDWGYVGASYQDLSSTYGIPFHGEHDEEEEDPDHEEESIFSTTESEILTFEGQFNIDGALLNAIQFSVRDTDYLLTEQHAEEAHEGEEHEGEEHEKPTFFSNDSTELQVILNMGTDDAPRRLVLNHASEEIAILGEEAFMETVKSTETTLGAFAGFQVNALDIDIGVRWDDVERRGTLRELHDEDEEEEEPEDHPEFELEPFTFKDQSLSGAISVARDLTDNWRASFNIGLVNRTPSAVELFMNGEHLATARYEVGDANLDTERSRNMDLSLNYGSDSWFATASIYRNAIDNYIYLRDELEEDHDDAMDHDDEPHGHGELLLAEFVQNDATFTGYELEIGRRFALAGGDLELRFQRDDVTADLSGNGSAPRITPARNVVALDYVRGMTNVMFEVQDVDRQTNIAEFETSTDGFTLVNARLSHRIELSEDAVLVVSAYGRNLTDEVGRNHTSFVKDDVPIAGRNVGIKASLSF